MATLPAQSRDSTPDDVVGDFVDLSASLISSLAAERQAQSRLLATIAQVKAEGDRQQRILARP